MSGTVALPGSPDIAEPFVDVEDIADVAAAVLTDDRHAGRICTHLPGGIGRDRVGERPVGQIRSNVHTGLCRRLVLIRHVEGGLHGERRQFVHCVR